MDYEEDAENYVVDTLPSLRKRIADLETLMEQLIWVAEKKETDSFEDTCIELCRQALNS